ncbi:monooxygenase [Gordonia sp. ABSL49_1]|uniref:monooxygenase n=1 Tax=Gordonia sp. ABSL49_1 TaxID=2920941 RepID=UPI0035B2FAF0
MNRPSPQVVEFRIWRVNSAFAAMLRMAGNGPAVRRLPGLRFGKLMGTGNARTFTPRDADPHHWALLTVWDDAAAAAAGATSRPLRSWTDNCAEELVVRLRPLSSRGRWARREPFEVGRRPVIDWAGPVAAITRARLRPTRAMSFWRAVPPVVAELADARGLRMALGIGEAPIGLQGTFSIWESSHALSEFAYRTPAHVSAIRRTTPQRWYAEELFARFAVVDIGGTYRGYTP